MWERNKEDRWNTGRGVSVLEKKEAEKRDRKRGWVGSHFNRGGWRRLHEKLTVD